MKLIPIRHVLLAGLLASQAMAQTRPPARPPRPQPQEPAVATATPEADSRGSYKQQRIDAIDEELAVLLQRRGETGVDQAMLELQIDLRLLARGIASIMPDKLDGKPENAAAYLRLQQVVRAGDEIALTVRTLTPPTEPQANALKALHELTYRPALDKPTVAAIDALTKEIATALSAIVPAPPVTMRPQRAVAPATAPAGNGSPTEAPLVTLSNAARRLNVTPVLRRQILTLTEAANVASSTGDATEARVLAEGLSDAVDLASGLAANTAVAMATRQEIEGQLAQGLALFTDPRTRDIGRKRLKTLAPYRQTLARVGKIAENPDTRRLAKLFVWAQENPEDGPKVLNAVEAYNRVVAEFEGRPRLASLPPNVKRAADATVRQFQTARATFMEEAISLPDGGMMAATPKQLSDTVGEMSAALAQLDLIETSPRSLDALLAFKPRPIGLLDKRVIAAVGGAVGEGKMLPEDAVAFLKSLRGLADAAARIGTDLPKAATGAEAWAGQGAAALQARLNAMLTEATSTLASADGVVSPDVLSQLAIAGDLVEALRGAAKIDEAIAACAPLARWADWGVDVQQLEAIVKAYRDGTAAAVDGLIDGSSGAVEQWPRMRQKYRPVIEYLEEISAYAPACATLPEGAAGQIAALATPFDAAAFRDVRMTGATLGIWGAAEVAADLTTAGEASGLVSRQLKAR
ncbi:MAG TPA: hypothetical protein VGN72_23160 [Tepidisphaeraceae bacterium]|jgi:hypothetical protein|nr:hypothetical protein [Tepidisphaeraceae bacterium]